jgi:metal-dependent hydrolase (beta-lactamase superfamily II)
MLPRRFSPKRRKVCVVREKTKSGINTVTELFLSHNHNDHRMGKSIDNSIDFAAKRQVWQRTIP